MFRSFMAFAAFVLALCASAQDYPSRPVRIVVPFPPGGQMDYNARYIANKLTQSLGKPVFVESKPGGQSIVGALEVMRSTPDGTTLLYTVGATFTTVPHLFSKAPFDPIEDFTPISQVALTPTVLLAPAAAPYNTFREMVSYAKANPGKLNYGSISATSQVYGELLKRGAAIDIVHVPYKGSGDAIKALIAGEIDLLWDSAFSALSQLKGKRVKPLVVTGPARFSALPDIPTASELGVKGLDMLAWTGFFGPKNMPAPVLARIHEELVRIQRTPEFRDMLINAANTPAETTPAELAAIVKREHAFWGEEIRKIGIKID